MSPVKKLKAMALFNNRKKLVITIINPSKKKFRNISINIDESINLKKEPFLKLYQFSYNHSDSCEESDYKILERFNIKPESIIQYVISTSY